MISYKCYITIYILYLYFIIKCPDYLENKLVWIIDSYKMI